MKSLTDFDITKRWAPQNPNVLQLYSFPTPNGIKVSAMLEESGLEYEPHTIRLSGDTTTPEFLSLNPNNKIPAIIDPDGPGGQPLPLWESGAILIYLADKTGKLISSDPAERYETLKWLMFQMGGLGPMFGQIGFFHKFAGKEIEDPRPKQRYLDEGARLLNVVEKHLEGRDYFVGDAYSIADISMWPWIRTIRDFYQAGDLIGLTEAKNTLAWLDRCSERPASVAALNIPDREG